MPTAVRAPSLPRSWCRACVGGSFRCLALPGTTVLLVLRLGALHHTSGHPCVAACGLWHLSPGHMLPADGNRHGSRLCMRHGLYRSCRLALQDCCTELRREPAAALRQDSARLVPGACLASPTCLWMLSSCLSWLSCRCAWPSTTAWPYARGGSCTAGAPTEMAAWATWGQTPSPPPAGIIQSSSFSLSFTCVF